MAVYTSLEKPALDEHLARYDIGALQSFAGIAEGVENTNYLLTTDQGKFILTLFEKRIRREDLPFYLSFMAYLQGKGIPCPAVVADKTGESVAVLAGKSAAITTFIEGAWPRETEAWHCAALGRLLAQMHKIGKNAPMKRKNTLRLPEWRKLVEACADKADAVEKNLFAALTTELDSLEKQWPKGLPHGTVHADLFPDNVFVRGKEISGIIDFYFSCTEFFVYDLMLTLNAWCFDKAGKLDREKSAALLTAYHEGRVLEAAELERLSFFGRAAALRIISTRLYDLLHPVAGATVTAKDPLEHVRILRFHQQAASPADYGFLL